MTDIFREVEEDLRTERYKALWRKYGALLIGAAVLFIAGVGGWRYYEWQGQQRAEATSEAFVAALSQTDNADAQETAAAFDALAEQSDGAYAQLAKFRAAAETGRADAMAGVERFDALADDTALPATWRDLARVRAGYLLLDTAEPADLLTRLEAITVQENPWRHSARDILAHAYWRAGDAGEARRYAQAITSDFASPSGIRARAETLLALTADSAGAS